MKPLRLLGACILAMTGLAAPSHGVEVAGSLLVNIDPTTLPLGPINWVTNSGTLGGVFEATGDTDPNLPQVVDVGGGIHSLMFDGRNYLQQVKAPGQAAVAAPAQLVGSSVASCSIEVWAMNPTVFSADQEAMVSWGTREVGNGIIAFGYGSAWMAAVERWGANMAWNPCPPAAQWHHLVYTYDGSGKVTKIYADGVVNNVNNGGIMSPVAGIPITIGAERNPNGTITGWGGTRSSLSMGKVRIHSGVLTDAQVAANYNAEKSAFVSASTPLAKKPIHRYTFNNTAGDASGQTVPDVAGGADAVVKGGPVTFTGTKVSLTGGSSASAPYVDLPNRLLSDLSADNAGSGQITIEGWVTVTGGRTWPRLFDIGSGTSGEITDIGNPGAQGRNYISFEQRNTYRDWHQIDINNNDGYNGGPSTSTGREFGLANDNGALGLKHYVVTWNESTGEVVVYENGVEAERFVTDKKFSHIDDVNVWLGRSNWTGDDNLQGDYDEFRIYDYVLSSAEVQNNYQAGPDAVAVTPGPAQALYPTYKNSMTAGTFYQMTVIGDFLNVSNITVTAKPGISYTSSDENILTVSSSGLVRALSAGTAKVTVKFDSVSVDATIVVKAVTAPLAHRYSFDNIDYYTIADSVGGDAWNGTAEGGSNFGDGQVVLDGSSGYVNLPAGLIKGQESVTIETWASYGINKNWARLYDFGDSTTPRTDGGYDGRNYIMFTPHSGNSDYRGTINVGTEQVATGSGFLDNQTNAYLAVVYNPSAGVIAMYVNGVFVGANSNVTISLDGVNDLSNYIGRSHFSADAFLNASLDEFRIYNGPLNAQQIAVNAAAGPNKIVATPGSLSSVSLVFSNLLANMTEQVTFTGTFANVSGVNLFGYGPVTISSSKPSVATVSATGAIKALTPGTTTITATYGGKTATRTLTVTAPVAVLAHRYSFDTDTRDSVGGSAWAGTLNGTAVVQDGKLVLDGTGTSYNQDGAYMILPGNMINGYNAVTIETWATIPANPVWTRICSFNDQNADGSGRTFLELIPRDGSGHLSLNYNNSIQNAYPTSPEIDGSPNLQHITAVVDPYAGYAAVYVDNQMVSVVSNMNIMLSGINNVNSWVGRSAWNADAYIKADIDEFRVYNGALTPAQIAVNNAAGPSNIVSSVGSLTGVRFVVNTEMLVQQSAQVGLLGDFANVKGVNLFAYGSPAPVATSSNPSVFTVTPSGLLTAVGPGSADLVVSYNGTQYTKTINVTATELTLLHRYSFNDAEGATSLKDEVGSADGTIYGGVTFNGNGQMTLNGTDGYVELPAGIISSLSNATFEVWVEASNSGSWQRVFDFGEDNGSGGGQDYVFLAGHGNPGMRFTVKPIGGGESPVIDTATPLMVGKRTYVAMTYNQTVGIATVYVDGEVVGSGAVTTPLNAIHDVRNWLGRSQYASDSYFGGVYDEFRIYEGCLTAPQIAANFASGPEPDANVQLKAELKDGKVVLSWPAAAAAWKLESSPVLGTQAQWTTDDSTRVTGATDVSVSLDATGQLRFYRLVK